MVFWLIFFQQQISRTGQLMRWNTQSLINQFVRMLDAPSSTNMTCIPNACLHTWDLYKTSFNQHDLTCGEMQRPLVRGIQILWPSQLWSLINTNLWTETSTEIGHAVNQISHRLSTPAYDGVRVTAATNKVAQNYQNLVIAATLVIIFYYTPLKIYWQ